MPHPQAAQKKESLKKSLNRFLEAAAWHHLERLDEDYFEQFSEAEIQGHIHALIGMHFSKKNSHVRLCPLTGNQFILTVLGFDFRGLFALLCGLLTLHGFDIRSGKIFTYRKIALERWANDLEGSAYLEKQKIVDVFELSHEGSESLPRDFENLFSLELEGYLLKIADGRFPEVRYEIHKRIAEHLNRIPGLQNKKLLPLEIDVETDERYSVLHIHGMDTPAFLFSLANALSMKEYSIHKVFIGTKNQKVEDWIFITDSYDRPVSSTKALDQLKITVALIKQFTLFLPFAPDSDLAIRQFDQFVEGWASQDGVEKYASDIGDARVLSSLAKMLGTGSYLWEHFAKMQHETLLPLLKDVDDLKQAKKPWKMREELFSLLKEARSFEEKTDIINTYKDTELFRIDLSHLVYPAKPFTQFSEELTELADAILSVMGEAVHAHLKERFGEPILLANPFSFCLFALGKFGGRELGYASDIEMILVYEEGDGHTRGNHKIGAAEFFNEWVRQLKTSIRAKEAGIFEIDLRLRPHGSSGPLSVHFPVFLEYYGAGGQALDYERQALLKLRPVWGDLEFGKRVLNARDSLLFTEPPLSLKNTLELRKKQLKTFVSHGRINAKYSEGALVDVEYAIQFLQLRHGFQFPVLRRQPNTIAAMEALLELECLTPTEFEKLLNGYAFLRRLINALRMVRGSARDLEMPEEGSDEFLFLARRMGYTPRNLSPEAQLKEDVESSFRAVRRFFEFKFIHEKQDLEGKPGLPELLSGKCSDEKYILEAWAAFHVRDTSKIHEAFKNAYLSALEKNTFLALLVLAERFFRVSPDPDKSLLFFECYLLKAEKTPGALKQLLFHPRYVELLVFIFGYSGYLANLLVNEPHLIYSIGNETALLANKTKDKLSSEMTEALGKASGLESVMEEIRKFRNREMLRVGLRDIYLNVPFSKTTREISDLSDIVLNAALHAIFQDMKILKFWDQQVVMALGKLGGRELNYSSDVDIVFVLDGLTEAGRSAVEKAHRLLIHHLTALSPHGQLFRVDTTLRPYGTQGVLSGTCDYYMEYYQNKADGWELQAWLKARPVAGHLELGARLIQSLQPLIFKKENRTRVSDSVREIRKRMLKQLEKEGISDRDIKSGPGGIRTIEFFVQSLQVKHGHTHPELITGHTLQALSKLHHLQLIPETLFHDLTHFYVFLRKVEHRIQFEEYQQNHLLPEDPDELARLALKMGFADRLEEPALSQFQKELDRIRQVLGRLVSENPG